MTKSTASCLETGARGGRSTRRVAGVGGRWWGMVVESGGMPSGRWKAQVAARISETIQVKPPVAACNTATLQHCNTAPPPRRGEKANERKWKHVHYKNIFKRWKRHVNIHKQTPGFWGRGLDDSDHVWRCQVAPGLLHIHHRSFSWPTTFDSCCKQSADYELVNLSISCSRNPTMC